MILGCDIGTALTKAVILAGDQIKYKVTVATNANPEDALNRVRAAFESEAGITGDDIEETVITGWGQQKVRSAHLDANHMNCLAKAAVWTEPAARSVLSLGAQQGVAISVGPNSRVLEYRVSDKCASGAGKFMDIITEALGCSVDETAALAAQSTKNLKMSSQCAVFAESEVVSLVNDGESVPDIVEDIIQSLVKNVITLCRRVRVKDVMVVGGGLMNNERILSILGDKLKAKLLVFPHGAVYMAAVGAALSAKGGQ